MTATDAAIHVHMSSKERELLERSLSSMPVYLEFGSGGSTEIAAAIGCPLIVSVESDAAWIRKLSDKPSIAPRVKDGSIRFKHVDIGPVGDWGAPLNESRAKFWPQYCMAPFSLGLDYGFVLVDGRFRPACALVSWACIRDDTLVAVHDYTIRPPYFDIEKFYDVVDRAETLVVFRKKRSAIINESYVFSLLRSAMDPL